MALPALPAPQQNADVKEVIDVFASFSENSVENKPRSWVSENPFADKE